MSTVKKSFLDFSEQDIKRWAEAHPLTGAFQEWLVQQHRAGLDEIWAAARTGNQHAAALNAGRTDAFFMILELLARKDDVEDEQPEEDLYEDDATRPSLRRKNAE